MGLLNSDLFSGDLKLEAAAVSDAAHVIPGSAGDHVRKIQLALNQLDGANLNPDGMYGPATAAAVLAYKRARKIINDKYQTQADEIVGKMTIVALDRELLGQADPKVVIGTPNYGPRQMLAIRGVAASAPPTPFSMNAIVRGNPYRRANATNVGLPPSVPPGHAYEVSIAVTPLLAGNDFIDLDVINTDALNGIAIVRPQRIQHSQTVIVLGSRQTMVGHGGKLKIQASFAGKILATSDGFTVCSHPVSVNLVSWTQLNDPDHDGMLVKETLSSDSGLASELDGAEWTERVRKGHTDTPPFGEGGAVLAQPSFLPCVLPQGDIPFEDSHGFRPFTGDVGRMEISQVHIFNCKRCRASKVPIPNSGFKIFGEVKRIGNEYKFETRKRGAAVSVFIDRDDRLPRDKDEEAYKTYSAEAGVGNLATPLMAIKPKRY
jgi:hypothetical protein